MLRDSVVRNEAGTRTASLIQLVVATFVTCPTESTALLGEVFEPTRIAAHGWEDVPALCREIKKLAQVEPKFAAQVFSRLMLADALGHTQRGDRPGRSWIRALLEILDDALLHMAPSSS